MDQQQMTEESFVFGKSLLGIPFDANNVIPDQSAKIFAAVIDKTDSLPDDDNKSVKHRVSTRKRKHQRTSRTHSKHKESARIAKFSPTLLQEEHALWLK
jgi:hypothetical protein